MSQEYSIPEEQPGIEEGHPLFVERETIPLSGGGEAEVLVKNEGNGKFSISANVRSAEEASEHRALGDVYYDKLKGNLPITGDGSIEGLLAVGRYVSELLPRLRELGAAELWVEGDKKRIDAYRKYLLRLGFEETLGTYGTPAFVYRPK